MGNTLEMNPKMLIHYLVCTDGLILYPKKRGYLQSLGKLAMSFSDVMQSG